METPQDFEYPVAGNRQFGIFKSGNDFYFYTLGVDRTIDLSTTAANYFLSLAFDGADDLWRGMQIKTIQFINSHLGSAGPAAEKIVRPK
jgi:hypothetical protein